jgi:hypothetical protein
MAFILHPSTEQLAPMVVQANMVGGVDVLRFFMATSKIVNLKP